jgi:hypothetical protein
MEDSQDMLDSTADPPTEEHHGGLGDELPTNTKAVQP